MTNYLLPNFIIKERSKVSEYFIKLNMYDFHRSYIPMWLEKHKLNQEFDLDSLWKVREECIQELSATS
ncbi:hypothetical protein ACEOWJ_001665 [Bacillus cereus]|uniref:hypothetical protein n=1 Tax=Bacillus TaxID=1386 RepID=UPI000AA4984E|nr:MULTISPECIES: hypothetical protein [unclassified Bacillus (in: firmicutes)]